MQAFAALLDALSYQPARNAKLRLIETYLRETPDPDRGWALAALTSGLDFPAAKPALLRGFGEDKIGAELFHLSYDYVGDLAETLSLIWFYYVFSIGSDQGIFNMDTRGTPSSTGHHGYSHLDTAPLPPPITTRADILAREMMAGTYSTPSGGGSGRSRGRRGSSHGHSHLKAAVVKRSTSKRGPGPHLKKHQILQQQLYQIQRDQEMDLQMALQLQQRQMPQQQLERDQKQERQRQEQQRPLKQQTQQQQQQRKAPHPQRHQHSQSLQLQHEFSSLEINQQQQQQEQQQQPRPGRPTKQRVLLRSESALAVLHGMHSSSLGSTLSRS